MPTLWRYVTARFAAAFAVALLTLSSIVLVVDMLLHVDDLLESGTGPAGVVALLLLRGAARYLPYLLPFATFLGAFVAVGLAARSFELLAIRAAGIDPLRALLPVFAAAALVSVATLLVSETLSVRASAELNRRAGNDSEGFYRGSGEIWYHTGRFIYNIRSPAAEAEALDDVRVLERSPSGRLVRSIEAAHADRIAPGRWRFERGVIRGFDPDRPDLPPTIEPFAERELTLAEDRSGRRLQGDLAAVPIWTLARYEPGPREASRIRAVLHQRLTSPLLVLLFALLAVPLGLQVEHTRSLARPAAQGVGMILAVLMVREYGRTLAAGAPLAEVAVPWLTLALFTGLGLWLLARAAR